MSVETPKTIEKWVFVHILVTGICDNNNYYPCTIWLTNVNPIGKIVYYALSFMYWIPKAKAHLTYLCALIGTSDFQKLTHNTKQVYVDYIDKHEEAYLWDIDINPRLHEFVKTNQHIVIASHAENINTWYVDSTLVSFWQTVLS